jgi:hypothetical protein
MEPISSDAMGGEILGILTNVTKEIAKPAATVSQPTSRWLSIQHFKQLAL